MIVSVVLCVYCIVQSTLPFNVHIGRSQYSHDAPIPHQVQLLYTDSKHTAKLREKERLVKMAILKKYPIELN